MDNEKKELGVCGIYDVINRIGKVLGSSRVLKKEFPIIALLSLFVCVVFFYLQSILNILPLEMVINPYVTLFGFSLSTFAIFITEVKDLEELSSKIENAKDATNDFISLSIIGLAIPVFGIVPNLITIPGFHIWIFHDACYWNVFFCSMSMLWITNSIIHVISIKIIKK